MSPPEHSKPSRSALSDWTRALQYTKQSETSPHTTILSVVGELATEHPDRLALIGEDEQLTYRALVERSNAYAAWTLRQELDRGEVVCLLMSNCPDYVAIWFGITQAGCAVALLNTNLVGDALLHSIRTAGSRRIIVSSALLPAIVAILPKLGGETRISVHGHGGHDRFERVELAVASAGASEGASSLDAMGSRLPASDDRALLIYTSGTTGLPKAATVTHARVLEWSAWFAGMMDAQPDDRLYNCLPMYHSTGGVVAIGSILSRGGSVLIRSRFSASRFWDDIVTGECTIFQYIGELCRYMTRSPAHALETAHKLRLACGNGMRGEVWEEFQSRFRIPRILEFYAATEGNVSLYNCEGRPGAIGRIPPFLRHRFPVELIRTDIETGEPMRDASGRCIKCAADEPGEAIGRIVADSLSPARHFDGYTDRQASARKVLCDVFEAEDRWFRTGDLMRRDPAGYYYFLDRGGDTFRWKGENVSTTEVAGAMSGCRGVVDAVVYGVAIPAVEGRAGMAAISTGAEFSFPSLRAHLHSHLPEYAHPLFVQVCDQIVTTGTFKLTKGALAAAGLAAPSAAGTLWFNDRTAGCFVKCDVALLGRVQAGAIAL